MWVYIGKVFGTYITPDFFPSLSCQAGDIISDLTEEFQEKNRNFS